jgi:hypothetical protein
MTGTTNSLCNMMNSLERMVNWKGPKWGELIIDRQQTSAKGAEYESPGQARSEAERVALGLRRSKGGLGLEGRNNISPFQG